MPKIYAQKKIKGCAVRDQSHLDSNDLCIPQGPSSERRNRSFQSLKGTYKAGFITSFQFYDT